jgi:hypothetical protein
MEGIYGKTQFGLGCRTSRFKPEVDKNIEMLDWDYLEWKDNPKEIEEKHLEITKKYQPETVMSMDLWEYNIEEAIDYALRLQQFCDRVLIPVHHWTEELLEFDLAYPNANWFADNNFPPAKYIPYIKHILGGSPQSQIKHLTTSQVDLEGNSLRFSGVESIDGNQIFNAAIRYGKEWYPHKPYWRNNGNDIENEVKFRNSVKRLDKVIKQI